MLAALQVVEAQPDINSAAEIFGKEIRRVLEKAVEKHDRSNKEWTGLVGTFLAKLYPFVKLSLRLTSAVAEVLYKTHEVSLLLGSSFSAPERSRKWTGNYLTGIKTSVIKCL